MDIQGWFPCYPGGSQESSPASQFKGSSTNSLRSAFSLVQLSHPYMTTGKAIALTKWTFVRKVMSLLLSRFVIAFLPNRKRLLVLWVQSLTIHSDFGAQENKMSLFLLFPHVFAMLWWDRMPWSSFWMLSFKPAFSLSSLILIKRLFSSSSLSAIRVVSRY